MACVPSGSARDVGRPAHGPSVVIHHGRGKRRGTMITDEHMRVELDGDLVTVTLDRRELAMTAR